MKQSRADDKTLIHSLLQGDSRVLRLLYKRLRPTLVTYLSVRISNRADAEELLQDIFLSFAEALPLFQFESSLETFLLSIAKHEVGDYWRKQYAKRVIRTVPILKSLPKVRGSEHVSGKLNQLIERVYRALTHQQALLLQMKYEEDLSIKEMAARLGMSTKSVESALFRARAAFKRHYEDLLKKPEWALIEVRVFEEGQ